MLPSVILEGPEGSGKSTAAQFITERFSYNYYHDGPPDPKVVHPGNFLKYYNLIMESFRPPWVWDRSIYGELVYGPIFRTASRISPAAVLNFLKDWRASREVEIITILLLPPFDVIKDNWTKNREEQFKKATTSDWNRALVKTKLLESQENLRKVYDAYAMIDHMFDHVIYSYPDMSTWIEVLG